MQPTFPLRAAGSISTGCTNEGNSNACRPSRALTPEDVLRAGAAQWASRSSLVMSGVTKCLIGGWGSNSEQ